MGEKSNSLQVSSQKDREQKDKDKAIHSSHVSFCSQDLLDHLQVPWLHRSQALKLFAGKNHCFWCKFNSVCIYEERKRTDGGRWSRAFLLMKCSL